MACKNGGGGSSFPTNEVDQSVTTRCGQNSHLWAERDFSHAARTSSPLRSSSMERAVMVRVYLDLDGVMADFDAHFPAVFGLDHRSMADDAMWSTINAHPSYFLDMPPCSGALEFFDDIASLDPIVLTACPRTNYANTAAQKREWVRRHLSPRTTVLPVMGGRNKPLFMHAAGDVLIDDFEKNTSAWSQAGGISILHRSFDDTRRLLRTALAVRAPSSPDRRA